MITLHSPSGAGKSGLSTRLAMLVLCASFAVLADATAQTKMSDSLQSTPAAPKRIVLADSIVAVVNTEVITRQELMEKMGLVEARMKQQNIAMPPRAELQQQLLERMIVDRAQLQLAKDFGIVIDDILLDRAIGRIAEQNKISMQEFRNQLERSGMSFVQYREQIREEIAMQRLREREVDNKIQISESEVDNYLASQSETRQVAQEYNLAQILVRIPENASADQIATRRQRAEDVLRQINAGGDFAKLAATYSDASDALNGGDLGWRNQDRLPQIFLDAVANLKTGEVSSLVKSANGFHIIKLAGKRAASMMRAATGPNATPGATGASGAPGPVTVEQTRVRHILIKVNQIVTSADARRKLVELKERLDNKAAKFEDLAKLYSNDSTASQGGDLGWIYPGDTVPEFERAMAALKPGEVSEPVESPFGFHLIQVMERKVDDVSKERLRLSARLAIRERKLEEATQDWLRQVRDRAYVEYRLDEK
ncbi:peptidylprolyl isomerase [soil metagenome]